MTSSRARLVDGETLACRGEYVASKAITVATATPEQVILALAGGEVLYFEIDVAASAMIPVSLQ